ncbi:hypothetical protein HHI36_016124 [Cryptolaemus montrouzieri]|uniref:Uncharacterized protein n=1 Tax=Cryptolaemus montrouzieri TaxID=559131 RepID=A0ABD2NJ96_9CUCU
MILSFFSLLFIVLGVVLVFCWEAYFNSMFHKELTLANDGTQQYKNWIETPIDINFEAYLFNWTNSDEFQELQKKHKKNLPKLKFEQIGPFHYAERHTRSNVVFNANYTISFNTVRKWIFDSVKTNLSLDTEITAVNPIALAVANVVKDQPYLIQRCFIFLWSSLLLSKKKMLH